MEHGYGYYQPDDWLIGIGAGAGASNTRSFCIHVTGASFPELSWVHGFETSP